MSKNDVVSAVFKRETPDTAHLKTILVEKIFHLNSY